MKTIVKVSHSLATKLLLGSVALLFLLGLVYVVPDWLDNKDYRKLFLIGIPMFVFFVWFVTTLVRFRIIVTESYIEWRDIRQKKFLFSSITTVNMEQSRVVLIANGTSIKIYKSVHRYNDLIREIISRVQKNPNVRILGDQRLVKQFCSNELQ